MSMLPDLHVIGKGAISPAGAGSRALLANTVPESGTEILLGHPEKSAKTRRVDLEAACFTRWKQEPRLRRASPIALFLMEAASQALENQSGFDRNRLGLVCALGVGSICYSHRFFADTIKRGRRFASPALFPETVYNSPVSHVASILGIGGACYSLVGDESCWVEALRVARTWLARGKAEAVLVVAGEELDSITIEAFYRAGWLNRGVIPSEGAGALLVQAASSSDSFIRPDPETAAFRSVRSQHEAWQSMLSLPDGSPPLILPGNLVYSSASKKWAGNYPRSGPDLGAAFATSSSWATLQILESQSQGILLVPGCNIGISRLQINP